MAQNAALNASRGTLVWGVNWFRQDALSRLLDDLLEKEKTGYSQDACDKVDEALGRIANQASALPDKSWWKRSILDELEDFLEIYRKWNNHEGEEPEKIEGRKKELKRLRAKRNKLASRIRKNQHIIQNDLDLSVVDAMYEALSDLARAFPDIFKSLSKALERYAKRK